MKNISTQELFDEIATRLTKQFDILDQHIIELLDAYHDNKEKQVFSEKKIIILRNITEKLPPYKDNINKLCDIASDRSQKLKKSFYSQLHPEKQSWIKTILGL